MTNAACRLRQGENYLNLDGRVVIPVGSHYVPNSGPDWPWRVGAEDFDAAFERMAAAGLDTVRIDLIWAAIEPRPGEYDADHLAVIDRIFDAAERHGMSLHPTLFVGGEVGDAYWDLPWASGRNPHTDRELLDYQAAHARHLAARWRDRSSLVAWDLTDEPPFWLYGAQTSDDDARTWTDTIVTALRSVDPDHLITIGTASQEIGHGPFRADVTAPYLDFCSVHPYPIYSPELYPDALRSPRMTLGAAFETALARGAGKTVMLHEYGASNTQFSEQHIADFDRLSTWTSLGSGAAGFYSWCWTDADGSAFRRAPYVRSPHETQFGMTAADGTPRKRLGVMTAMAETLASLDLDGRVSFGPYTTVAMPVPHEFVRPFDRAAFGLDDAPSGSYMPSELAWRPDRDVTLLVRGWLNAYVLAARAGLSVQFDRERLDGQWPDAQLVLAPAPLTTTSNSLVHLRTTTLSGVSDLHDQGRMLYLSLSAETAIPELADVAGVSIADRAPVVSEIRFTMVADFGGLKRGDSLTFAGSSSESNLRGVLLDVGDAEVLATDDAGNPVFTRARIRSGQTVVCAYPIELLLAGRSDAHGPDDDSWRLYAALAEEAGARVPARAEHPELSSHLLTGPQGAVLIVSNHSAQKIVAPLVLPDGIEGVSCLAIEASGARLDGDSIALEGYGVAVVTWAGSLDQGTLCAR